MTAFLVSILALFSFVQTPPPAVSAEVRALLVKMEQAGDTLESLSARLDLSDTDRVLGTTTTRIGTLALRRDDTDAALRILFNVKKIGESDFEREKLEYLLVGDTLYDRNYKTKTEVRRKLDERQQQVDLFKMGEGPFPLPIGQPVDEVIRQFSVELVDTDDPNNDYFGTTAPEGTQRLRLVPRPATPLAKEFAVIEVDVDPESGMPRQIATLNAAEDLVRIVELTDIRRDADVQDDFEPGTMPNDWTIIIEGLRDQTAQ